MKYLRYILADGCSFAFLPFIAVLTLISISYAGASSVKGVFHSIAFCLFLTPCILAACGGFARRVYRQSAVLRCGRKGVLAVSLLTWLASSLAMWGSMALFALLAVPAEGWETPGYWLCLWCQVLLIGAWYDFLQVLTKRMDAFLILFLCCCVEFTNVFLLVGLEANNPLLWNYALFTKDAHVYGPDIDKSLALIAALCAAKGRILVKRKDFLWQKER